MTEQYLIHTYSDSIVHPQKQLSLDAKSQGDPWGSQQTHLVTELLGRDVLFAVTSAQQEDSHYLQSTSIQLQYVEGPASLNLTYNPYSEWATLYSC